MQLILSAYNLIVFGRTLDAIRRLLIKEKRAPILPIWQKKHKTLNDVMTNFFTKVNNSIKELQENNEKNNENNHKIQDDINHEGWNHKKFRIQFRIK